MGLPSVGVAQTPYSRVLAHRSATRRVRLDGGTLLGLAAAYDGDLTGAWVFVTGQSFGDLRVRRRFKPAGTTASWHQQVLHAPQMERFVEPTDGRADVVLRSTDDGVRLETAAAPRLLIVPSE